MKRIIFVFIALLLYNCVQAQTINFLDEKDGFRELKLGSLISDCAGLEKKTSSNDNLFRLNYGGIPYSCQGDYYLNKPNDLYRKLQNTEILRVYVQSFEGMIQEINLYLVLTPSLLEYFQLAFGKPNFGDCKCIDNPEAMQLYNWVGENVTLFIGGIPKTNLAIVKYSDNNLSSKRHYEEYLIRMHEKEKRLEDAKNDF
jgi:hypothetical protein